ncbi:hypothetical protein FSW04_11925 [Baekduia soli]|uniref:Flippase-like domain-containing protein n=1 Tax=Baekduia soli TaxID=496014 RepID=A0A5B8U6B7_9ACTN|nr:lysylphosphatidylglycerol synthase transmembrane domain-containing protein [Baekduia soli]QEC48202.1 hypothetical protein FSW04_11925 [Baekduia soli]
MREVIDGAIDRAHHAADLLLSNAVDVDPLWLVAGVLAHLAAQVVRIRGWWNILRVAYPAQAAGLRHRDVTVAYLAGSGINGLLPARAGDVVKYTILHRRLPGSRYSTLAATSLPETLFESALGAVLVVWMLARGFLPVPAAPGDLPGPDASTVVEHPVLAAASVAAAVLLTVVVLRWAGRRSRVLLDRLRQGLTILRRPRLFMTGVATWQALGRVIRLGSLACFLNAFGLPATVGTAVLVMAAQSGGRIVPIAPVSTGLRIVLLAYGLVEVTGRPVDPGAITVFTVGVSATLFVVMLAISVTIVARELGAHTPRGALRAARAVDVATPVAAPVAVQAGHAAVIRSTARAPGWLRAAARRDPPA